MRKSPLSKDVWEENLKSLATEQQDDKFCSKHNCLTITRYTQCIAKRMTEFYSIVVGTGNTSSKSGNRHSRETAIEIGTRCAQHARAHRHSDCNSISNKCNY
ncbi:hypothetical protein PR048_010732 [Dryococelus australis]|uniref:Uncharacterized protein n=1 Tax=Dryococelus australis TaxID=614101 RepID=A0ABQ9I406_9NEOP|nr:hypothetical protein PR048_010732 [Dryococelus australis]